MRAKTERPIIAMRRLAAPLLVFALALAGARAGETRVFTAPDGRAFEGEILGFRGELLRVRRADTGKEFPLPIASLAETDRQGVRDFLREHPELRDAVRADDVRLEFSRAKFEREIASDTSWRDENIERCGYSLGLANLTQRTLEGLRIDYVLFVRTDPDNIQSRAPKTAGGFERVTGSEPVAPVAPGQRAASRTQAVTSTRVKYTDGARIVAADGKLRSSWRDKVLHGVWFRVYDGDRLVQEASAPESLRTSERWGSPSP